MSSQLEVVRRGLVVPSQTRTTFGLWLTLLGSNTTHSAASTPSPSGDLMSPDRPHGCQPIEELAPSSLVSQKPAWVSGCMGQRNVSHTASSNEAQHDTSHAHAPPLTATWQIYTYRTVTLSINTHRSESLNHIWLRLRDAHTELGLIALHYLS